MKTIIKYIDKPLFIVTIILFIIGLIMVFSASNVTAYMTYEVSPYNYFFKQDKGFTKKRPTLNVVDEYISCLNCSLFLTISFL